MSDMRLAGCRVEPLGSYLKALGVLRLIAEQADASAAAWWSGDEFWLRTTLSENELVDFFVNRYSPTPLLAPWNKGSGFGQEDATKSKTAVAAVSCIETSNLDRLAEYRRAIAVVQAVRLKRGWYELDKDVQVAVCRNELPDDCLRWLDATVVLTANGRAFPPLLGTGGNDGRFDFASNFMQRIAELFGLADRPRGAAQPEELLRAALLAAGAVRLDRAAIGQFDPAGAGGPGSSPLGSAESLSNPWDFVLLLEGALVFASAAARRLSGQEAASVPFIVPSSAAGFASAAQAESTRGELWAPLWERPARFAEIDRLISEGRAEYNGRQATSGLDLARSLATLGVDRGISGFVRHGFMERNGLATFAVPLGRVEVKAQPGAAVLGQLDAWALQFRYLKNAPDTVGALLRQLDDAQFAVTAGGGPVALQRVLSCAAELDALSARSRAVREKVNRPLAGRLSARDWLPQLNDGSVEFELAVSLASLRSGASGTSWTRELIGPRAGGLDRPPLVAGFGRRPIVAVLADCLARLAIDRQPADAIDPHWLAGASPIAARLLSVEAFLAGDVDDRRVGALLAAMCLLDWRYAPRLEWNGAERHRPVHPALALIAPFFHSGGRRHVSDGEPAQALLIAERSWPRLMMAGLQDRVLEQAIRRLRISGHWPLVGSAADSLKRLAGQVDPVRLAAACLIPISNGAAKALLDRCATSQPSMSTTQQPAQEAQ
jgi:CRISPR-associated protein Csx17